MRAGYATWLALLRMLSSPCGRKMKEHKCSTPSKNTLPVLLSKCSVEPGDFRNIISKEQDILTSKKWNADDIKNDREIKQIAGIQANARKRKTSADQTSGTNSGQDAVKERNRPKKFRLSSGVPQQTTTVISSQASKKKKKLCGKTVTSKNLFIKNSLHEDTATVPPKKITKAHKGKDDIACSLVAAKSQGKKLSPLLKQTRSGGLWLLKSCDLLNIGRVPLFMMQRKLFQIAACGKLQSEKLRARKTSYRLLDFNWMWFRKGFWNCCKKTLRGRIRKAISYLKLKLQRSVRAGRRAYDMNNNTSGILYEIPQCTTKSCLRDDPAVKLQSVEPHFGNAASSQQALLCTPAHWCGSDTLPKKTSDFPVSNNQPDDLCLLLPEKEVCIPCQEETTAHGKKDDVQIPLPPQKWQECTSDVFECQENASMDIEENGEEPCPMDLDDSTDSVIFLTKLLDHPYCKSPIQQTTCEGLHIQGLPNGQKTIRVPDEQVASTIWGFLHEVVKKYGSLIPLTEKDVLAQLKEAFNQDFSDRIPFINKEIAKYKAKNYKTIGCGFRICYNRHTLDMHDLETLDHQKWINDQVVNMYGDLLMDAAPEKVHFFNTFFHKQLVTKGYEGVKRWTKKVDIFKKTLILIPIHLLVHWVLVAVNIPNKTISFYDSQGVQDKNCTENIFKYLVTEASEKNHPEFFLGWHTIIKKCIPQQKNDFDCGAFMLQYCKCLALEQPFLFSQEDMPRIRKGIYKELCERRLLD
ncbi:sentrin-specific protease 5 isoform 2-T2 [Leptodactylus fuscus]|uniref:sentrin-specific protease 5 isoform X2 n=1 Tax=Leptodactylus fuscus TaxID=238119 RepID=UPI003F4EFAA0